MADLASKIRDIPDFPGSEDRLRDIMLLLADAGRAARDGRAPRGVRRAAQARISSSGPRRGDSSSALRSPTGFAVASFRLRKPGKLLLAHREREVRAGVRLRRAGDSRGCDPSGERACSFTTISWQRGTARAKVDLVEQLGGEVVGLAFVIELEFSSTAASGSRATTSFPSSNTGVAFAVTCADT